MNGLVLAAIIAAGLQLQPGETLTLGDCYRGCEEVQVIREDSWSMMSGAPLDGTVIEIKNTYGLLATYGLFRWSTEYSRMGGWVSATDPRTGLGERDGPTLGWRPYKGAVKDYVDHNPSMADWRRAMHRGRG